MGEISPLNIILTGLPRSGTNLTCRLLGRLPNVVALQEPMNVEVFGQLGGFPKIKEYIDAFFSDTRKSALERGGSDISQY